jgi:hypothetical protein
LLAAEVAVVAPKVLMVAHAKAALVAAHLVKREQAVHLAAVGVLNPLVALVLAVRKLVVLLLVAHCKVVPKQIPTLWAVGAGAAITEAAAVFTPTQTQQLLVAAALVITTPLMFLAHH